MPEVAHLRGINTLEQGRVIESLWFLLLGEHSAAKASAQHAVTSSACPLLCLLAASVQLEAVVLQCAGIRHLYTPCTWALHWDDMSSLMESFCWTTLQCQPVVIKRELNC